MSIRAHVQTSSEMTENEMIFRYSLSEAFNLTHDKELVQELNLLSLNDDCCGILYISHDELVEILENKKIPEEQKTELRKLFKKSEDDGGLHFDCY